MEIWFVTKRKKGGGLVADILLLLYLVSIHHVFMFYIRPLPALMSYVPFYHKRNPDMVVCVQLDEVLSS